jgi:WD40 repeat protein
MSPGKSRKSGTLFVASLLALTLVAALISCLPPRGSQPGGDSDGGTALRGHTRPVQALAFGRDGATLSSAAYRLRAPGGWELAVWDLGTRNATAHRIEHAETIYQLVFGPEGRTLVATGQDGTLWLGEAAAPSRRRAGEPRAHVTALAFSGDGDWLATVDFANLVMLWDVASDRPRIQWEVAFGPLTALTFAPDGKALAGAANDQSIRLWDAATGSERGRLRENRSPIVALAFSPDGGTLACGDAGGVIKLWDVAAQAERATLATAGDALTAMAFAPDGRTLAVAVDSTVQLWDLATGHLVARLREHEKQVQCLAFSPDGKLLASGSYDQTVRLWDVARYRPLGP